MLLREDSIKTVAGLPLNVKRYNDSGRKEKAFKHPIYRLLHDESNPQNDELRFPGNAHEPPVTAGSVYVQIIRSVRGEVIALYPLKSLGALLDHWAVYKQFQGIVKPAVECYIDNVIPPGIK